MLPPTETFLHRDATSMYAAIDADKPDLRRFPEWSDARVIDVVVEPGEALFIPVGWWHHVRSLDVSISLSLTNFRYPNDFGDYCPGAITAPP
jgi:ribosomal protein L16 Arg81 hydroxylase